MDANEVTEKVARWFEDEFPCRQYRREIPDLHRHLRSELEKWLSEQDSGWHVRRGRKGFVNLFGWSLETDLELQRDSAQQTIPIEVKLVRRNHEYYCIHAMGQAIYYSTTAKPAIALVVHQGRGKKGTTPEERKLQADLCNKLSVKLAIRKV